MLSTYTRRLLKDSATTPPQECNLVQILTKIEMKATIIKETVLRADVFGEAIINRIQPITDMVAAGCNNLYICTPKVDVKKGLALLLKKLIVL